MGWRRGVLKGVGWSTLVLLLVIIGALAGGMYLWRQRSGQVAGRIAEIVNDRVLGEDTRLTIARIRGNPLQTVILYDVQLHRHDAGGNWHRVLRAPEVHATYSFGGLVGSGQFDGRIVVLRPEVRLDRLADSTLALPTFRKGKGGGAPVRVPEIEIRDGQVVVETARRDVSFRGVHLEGGLLIDGGTVEIALRDASLVLDAPSDTVRAASGLLRLEGNRLEMNPLAVKTAGSDIEARGALGLTRGAPFSLAFDLRRVDLSEVNRFQKISPPLRPGGYAGGRASIARDGGPARLEWAIAGVVGPDSVASFTGTAEVEDETFHARGMRLVSGVLEVRGAADITVRDRKEYDLDLDVTGFDLSNPPLWPLESELPPMDLNGHVLIEGVGFGTGVTDLTVTAELGPSRVDLFDFDSGTTRFRVLPDESFDVESAEIISGSGRVTAHGTFHPDGPITMPVRTDRFPIESLHRYWKDLVVRGNADLEGMLTGPTEHPRFTATGSLSPFQVADVVSDSVTVLSAQGDLIPVIIFETTVEADSARLVGQPLRDVTSVMHVAPGEVLFRSVNARLDSLRFEGNGSLRGRGRESELRVPELHVEAGAHVWSNNGEIVAKLSRETFVLEPARLVSNGSALAVSARSSKSGDMMVGVETHGLDLSLLDPFSPRPLSGRADVTARIEGMRDALDGHLDMEVRDLHAGADSLDLLRAGIDVDGGRWAVRELSAQSGGGRAEITGSLDWGAPLGEVVRRLRARDREALAATALDLSVAADSLPLPMLAGAADTLLPAGLVDARGHVRGTLGAPELDGTAGARNGKVALVSFDRVSASVLYGDGVLTLSGGSYERGTSKVEFSGYLPLDLGLRWPRPGLPERAMRLSFSAEKGDLALASEIFPTLVGDVSGTFRGLVILMGTPRHARASGRLLLREARFRPLARSEVFYDGEADVSISEEGGVRVERLSAKQGKRGRIEGSGTFRTMRDFEFTVRVRDGILHQFESFDARIDGEFAIRPDATTIPGKIWPRVTGTARVKEAVVFQEFGLAPRPVEQLPWLFDIEAEVPNRLFVRNRSADLELGAAAPIIARNEGGAWLFTGTLDVLRGEYAAPQINARFRITSGTIDLIGLPGEQPRVDITAETRVPRLTTSAQKFITVTVRLVGPITMPTVTLESDDPDLTQAEIMQILTVGRLQAEGQEITPTEVGSSVVVTQFFQQQFRDLLPGMGSAGISIEPAADEQSQFTVRVSRYLAAGILVEYAQGLSLESGQEIALEYRVSRNLFLRGGVVREKMLEETIGDEYNLDLKFKIEY